MKTEQRISWKWPFEAPDWLAALVTWSISQACYFWSAQPNVGLLDSGEFLTAAVHLGVPHPTGYPLWTIGAWLFQILPIGNNAWEVNLFSGFCTAIATGLVSLILCNSMRWAGVGVKLAQILSVGWSLALAFSVSMWSQAVIAEVYGLHSLVVMLYVWVLYRWLRAPEWTNGLAWAAFFFALGMSNHHLMISLSVLPVLVMILCRRDFLAEGLLYLSGSAALVYWGFGYLSQEPATWHSAVRLLWCVGLAFVLWMVIRKRLAQWKTGLLVLVGVAAGLSPYAYMPMASATNPPMNWGFTSTKEGFFYSVNRSQYSGKLSDQLLKTVGRVMGATPPELLQKEASPPGAPVPASFRETLSKFSQLYWRKLVQNFTPLAILALVAIFASLGFLLPAFRSWIFVIAVGFALAGFLQPAFDQVGSDEAAWLLYMPFMGYSHAFFVLLAGLGTGLVLQKIRTKPAWVLTFASIIGFGLIAFALRQNLSFCSQRNHWFGWMYGRDMLSDLPKDAFVFGGTDPGRFVPTYMILSESFEKPKHKRDPKFDRRDLYIITQNALADAFYNQYIRNHYSAERPAPRGWVDRWLGRDKHYPPAYLILPRQEDIMALYQGAIEARQKNPAAPDPNADPTVLNSMVAEWIWQRNKDQRPFFVEESFPMEWSYPNAVPHGLCYEIKRDPVPILTPEQIQGDMEYWRNYINRLKADPGFMNDIDAQRSFSKLRNTGGNIYKWRNMAVPAEQAYRQALELWPGNTETLNNFSDLLLRQGRSAELRDILSRAVEADPNNGLLVILLKNCERKIQLQGEITVLLQQRTANPKDPSFVQQLLGKYSEEGNIPAADQLIGEASSAFPTNAEILRDAVNYFALQNRVPQALEYGRKLEKVTPQDPEVKYGLAKFVMLTGNREEFYKMLGEAVQYGGLPMRERISAEPMFQQIQAEPEFQKLVKPTR